MTFGELPDGAAFNAWLEPASDFGSVLYQKTHAVTARGQEANARILWPSPGAAFATRFAAGDLVREVRPSAR